MLDKMRLHLAGLLPNDYLENLGKGFDRACCQFLGVSYEAVRQRVLETGDADEKILDWCMECGRKRDSYEIEIWNAYMRKFGWNDAASPSLARQIAESGYPVERIRTIFEFIDFDESVGLKE